MGTPAELLSGDLGSFEVRHGVVQGFWQIERRDGERIYVILSAPDEQAFTVELDCTGYGEEPIAGRFVDPSSHQCVSSAWPRGDNVLAQWLKWDPANLFVCWDQDRLGVEHHPEWRIRRAWKKNKNQIYTYLEFLRKLFHLPSNGYCRAA
jgi:hypothetical protein